MLGNATITVDISASGYSDAIAPTTKGDRFVSATLSVNSSSDVLSRKVTPEVRQMTFKQFLEIFKSPDFSGT